MSKTLIAAGEFFHDLIFYDLDSLPCLGEEMKTDSFEIAIGGGAPITSASAARLGRAVELVTVRGDSPLDLEARDRLAAFGVMENRSLVRPGQRSGLTVAVSTRRDRYFLTSPGANRHVEGHLLNPGTFADLEAGCHVHFALTPSAWAPFQRLIETLREGGVTTSWDLGWDPAAARGDAFVSLRASLDVLFLNEHEAIRYTDSERIDQAMEVLSRQSNTVVIKLGSRGAAACLDGDRLRSNPVAVEALETTGAGDAFNGGFLHAWMDGKPIGECLLAGNICGACSTRQPGGTAALPSATEFGRLWEEHRTATRHKETE